MKAIYLFIALLLVSTFMVLFMNQAHAGGPWNDQYCDIETTQIRVIDQSGNIIEEKIEEKVTCNDGAKDFLFDMGIADSCQMYTWWLPIKGTLVEQRDIACHKMDGGYEIVPGYHSTN
tara:strand:+ start:912 stop:1265 length:354 start_codon:yes stop_codon:yes gene_type:complete